MRYKVAGGIEIKTENAAKPEAQACQFLLHVLERLKPVKTSFDYGCGKLRYERAIAESTDTLTIVDSEIQVSRQQILRGKRTSIRALFKHSNRVQVHNDLEFSGLASRFDRGFCINVLSVN